MALFVENFGGKVFGSATDRKCVIFSDVHFGEAEVGEPEVADFINENVLRLETV